MKIDIHSVAGKGIHEKECLVLKVLSDTDIGDYVVFCTGYARDEVTTAIRHSFWFPYKKVHKGDLVILYTKPGLNNETTREDGSKLHFFYWDVNRSIWKQKNHAAVLLHAPNWTNRAPDEL